MFEKHPSFEGNNNIVNSQIFKRVIKFGKCAM
jgi:ribosomal protein L31